MTQKVKKGSKRYRIFNRAIQILRRDGWTQGVFRADDGSRCVMAALEDAAYDLGYENFNYSNDKLTCWNDQDGRTATQVYARLKKMAGKP